MRLVCDENRFFVQKLSIGDAAFFIVVQDTMMQWNRDNPYIGVLFVCLI